MKINKTYIGLYDYSGGFSCLHERLYIEKKNEEKNWLNYFIVQAASEDEAKRKVFDQTIGGYHYDDLEKAIYWIANTEYSDVDEENNIIELSEDDKILSDLKDKYDLYASSDVERLSDDMYKSLEKDVSSLDKTILDDIIFYTHYFDIYVEEDFLNLI